MFENIRRIGIFMIAAQTVMHFAAGKQYEKYMRVITGVIILLMFIAPFISDSENPALSWQTEAERLERQLRSGMKQELPFVTNSAEAAALQQIEEEIKVRLNDAIPDDDYRIADVVIELEETDGPTQTETDNKEHSWVFHHVKVTLQANDENDHVDTYGGGIILIDEITVGYEPEEDMEQEEQVSDQDAKIPEYQHIFAQILGIADDRVEVTYRGGR